MHESIQDIHESYSRDVKRVLSDIALVEAGAEFRENILIVPEKTIAELKIDGRNTDPIPERLQLYEHRNEFVVRSVDGTLRKVVHGEMSRAYRHNRNRRAIEELDSNNLLLIFKQ